MGKFETYLDEKNIISYLCRIRAKIAKNRNKQHLIHLISTKPSCNYHLRQTKTKEEEEICRLFPSRKKWLKLGEKNRYRYGKKLNTLEKNKLILELTIEWYRRNKPDAKFLKRLDEFIHSVQESISDKTYSVTTPMTYPQKKEKSEKGKTVCRPISIFNLKDRIIIGMVNKYFTDLFDDFFYDNSLAFRSVKKVDATKKAITHHHAIKSIIEYKNKNKNKNLWVAECDMRKFYDSVNHTIIKKSFKKFINKVKKSKLDFYNEDAERIFYSYVDCYSFNKCVYPKNADQEYFLNHNIPNGVFEWIDNDLIHTQYKKLNNAKIGVPQGGALSGLIANLVLHYSDSIIFKRKDKNLLYLRFCDDIIVMHPNKRTCQAAVNAYKRSLLTLKLFPHEFETIGDYSKQFWFSKSKKPYKWGEINDGNIPWIGFVGYELNFNGDIRIRKSSLKKEMSKQVEVIRTAYNAIKGNNKRTNDRYIEQSIIYRLIGMSVGRVAIWNYQHGIKDLCWINGFSELKPNSSVAKQLKSLDRNRNKYFNQFRRKIKRIQKPEKQPFNSNSNRQIVYLGKPFSYYYHAYEKPSKNVI